MLITNEWIELNRTQNGAWNAKQLRAVGVRWPPRHGWRRAIVGKWINEENQQIFESFAGKRESVTGMTAESKALQVAQDCGCDHVLPWEDCEHTEAAADNAMRDQLNNHWT